MMDHFGFPDVSEDDSGSTCGDSGYDGQPDGLLRGILRPLTEEQKGWLDELWHDRINVLFSVIDTLKDGYPDFDCRIGQEGIECKPNQNAVFTFMSRPPDGWTQADQFRFEVMFRDCNSETNDWMRHQTVCCKIIQRAVRAFLFRKK
jgi:hypothetical protein